MEEVAYSIFRFCFLEVGGVFRKYWGKYTDGVDGLIYVIDGTVGHDALDDAVEALEEFFVDNAEARSLPVAVLLSKADRHGSTDTQTAACKKALERRTLLSALAQHEPRVFAVASFSSEMYSSVKAEADLRTAMDWFVSALLSAAAKAM